MKKLLSLLTITTLATTAGATTVVCGNHDHTHENKYQVKLTKDNFKQEIEKRIFHFNVPKGTLKKDLTKYLNSQLKQQLIETNVLIDRELFLGWTDIPNDEQLNNGIELWKSDKLQNKSNKNSTIRLYENKKDWDESKTWLAAEAHGRYTITIK